MKKLVDAIKNLLIGLGITAKHFPRKHITLQYPDERWPMPERSRGVVVLLSDKETGELNCTACLLCMRSCPTAAIRIEFEKDEKGKRSLKQFHVDNTLCCYCGLCEEACNFDAIKLAPKYEFATYNKEDLVWDVKKLQEMGRDVPYEVTRKKKGAKEEGEGEGDGEKPARPRPAAKPAPKAVAPSTTEPAPPPVTPAEAPKPINPEPKPEGGENG